MADYKIQSGDTLSKIAASQGTTVDALMAANPNIKNANAISAGANLVLPGAQNQSMSPANMSMVSPNQSVGSPTKPTLYSGQQNPALWGGDPTAKQTVFGMGSAASGADNLNVPTPTFNTVIPEIDPEMKKLQLAAMGALANANLDIDTITKRLMSESGTVSSATSEVSDFVRKAVDYQKQAQEASRQAVTESFGREKDYSLQKLQDERTAMLEKSVGGGDVSPLALQSIDRQIEKSLRDLESRKQEAIATNDAAAYKTISDLQMSEMEQRINARQKVFDNMLGIATFGQKKYDYVGQIANMARTMSQDDMDRAIKIAQLEVAQANSVTDAISKNNQLQATLFANGLKGNGLFPGWKDRKVAEAVVPMLIDSKQKIVSQLSSEEADGQEFFAGIYKQAVNDANTQAQRWQVAGTRDAVLSAYGLIPDKNGNPVLYVNDGMYLHSNGQITPNVDMPDDPTQAANMPRAGKGWLSSSLGRIFGMDNMLMKATPFPGAYDILDATGALDKLQSAVNLNRWREDQKLQNETPDKVSFGDPSSLLLPIMGWTAKTAYADDGTYPEDDSRSFFERLASMFDNTVTYDRKVEEAKDKAKLEKMYPTEDTVHPMAKAMAQMEGWFAADSTEPNKPQKNNNPGNLKYAGQPGAVGKDKDGFAVFETPGAGWNALQRQLQSAATGTSSVYKPDMSLYDFFKKYAPSADKNNPTHYAKFVADKLGVPPTAKLADIFK